VAPQREHQANATFGAAHRIDPQAMPPSKDFKGNKQSLPAKPCCVCGRPMSWRKKWEKTWEQVKYCSQACRLARPSGHAP